MTIDLGSLSGSNGASAATDINASGQVVGTSGDRSFIWQNGVMTDLGTLGAHYSGALGLNDLGQVVGYSAATTFGNARAFLITPEDTDGNGTPDRWNRDTNSDGKNDLMRDLGTIGGSYTYAVANDVNNLGQVVGTLSNSLTSHAFRWQNGVMTDLGTFGGQRSSAYTINNAGQVGGEFNTMFDGTHAFLWKNGVVTDLGSSSGGVTDINAAGRLIDATRVWTPTVPNGSSGTFTTTLGQLPRLNPNHPDDHVGVSPDARSINSAGQVVGNQVEFYWTEWAGSSTAYRAMRWVNGVPEELPLSTATAINDAGQIVGTHTRSGNSALLTEESLVLPLLTIEHATGVVEGHSGTTEMVFTVRLSRPSSQTVTVDYATANGSAGGGDYVPTSGRVTFNSGQTSKTLSVQVVGDRAFEYDTPDYGHEIFYVTLSNASNAIADRAPGWGVISDDEPRITSDGATVVEGNSGSKDVSVTVRLSSPYDQPVTVDYATKDQSSATAGSDYLATSGTVTFAPGQTTKQFPVTIMGDRVAEYIIVEYLGIILSNPTDNAGIEDLYVHSYLNIQEDEPFLSITPDVSVNEGHSGTTDAVFTVSLSVPYDQDVTVEYRTYDGDDYYGPPAHAGSDYVTTSGTLRIPAGQTSGTVSVPVIGDVLDETMELFYLALANPSSNAWLDDYTSWGLGWIGNAPAKTWVGPASGGNWSTAADWSPAGVPTAGDHVAIAAGKSVNLGGSATVASLTLSDGATLAVAAHGSRLLRTSALSISADSTLNLNDNDLIVDYAGSADASPMGSWNGASYGGVTGLIARGYAFGAWTGSGLITTMPQARTGVATLAVAEAADTLFITGNETALWGGQTVDATTVLVKYTYAGDVNLDGAIDGADYGTIDNWVQFAGTSGYTNGDFNLDGVIDGADYGLIDNSSQLQGAPL